jgi:hypothetical protein
LGGNPTFTKAPSLLILVRKPCPPLALETEYNECVDLWRDRFDDRAEQLWNYHNRG